MKPFASSGLHSAFEANGCGVELVGTQRLPPIHQAANPWQPCPQSPVASGTIRAFTKTDFQDKKTPIFRKEDWGVSCALGELRFFWFESEYPDHGNGSVCSLEGKDMNF